MARKNSTFISLKTCFDLFLYTGGWIEKLNFKEKYTESNSLIEEFLCYSNEVLMLRKWMKKKLQFEKMLKDFSQTSITTHTDKNQV